MNRLYRKAEHLDSPDNAMLYYLELSKYCRHPVRCEEFGWIFNHGIEKLFRRLNRKFVK